MKRELFVWSVVIAGLLAILPGTVRAHCDTMDGPVVITAKAALEKGDVAPVLKWVQKAKEAEIKDAFAKTLAVRKQSPEAKELADRYFFETLVRVHRAGEGAPYTGLKPAGTEIEPGVVAADKALETGKVDELVKDMSDEIAHGIRERFARVQAAKKDADKNVAAGREYVEAYVGYVHYVEGLHEAAKSAAHGHYPETEHHAGHQD
jgi:hypothetical protein